MPATPLNNTLQAVRSGARYDNQFVAGDNVNGNSFPNPDGQTALLVTNTAGGTVTIKSAAVADPLLTPPSLVVTLTANQSQVIGPFNPAVWGTSVVITPSVATISFLPLHISG